MTASHPTFSGTVPQSKSDNAFYLLECTWSKNSLAKEVIVTSKNIW